MKFNNPWAKNRWAEPEEQAKVLEQEWAVSKTKSQTNYSDMPIDLWISCLSEEFDNEFKKITRKKGGDVKEGGFIVASPIKDPSEIIINKSYKILTLDTFGEHSTYVYDGITNVINDPVHNKVVMYAHRHNGGLNDGVDAIESPSPADIIEFAKQVLLPHTLGNRFVSFVQTPLNRYAIVMNDPKNVQIFYGKYIEPAFKGKKYDLDVEYEDIESNWIEERGRPLNNKEYIQILLMVLVGSGISVYRQLNKKKNGFFLADSLLRYDDF